MKKNEIVITEEERQVASNELAQIIIALDSMKKTGAEICINVANYCAVRGDQKVIIERTGLSNGTVSKMNKVGKLFNKAIQKFGENSLEIVTDVNWSDVYKNASYYDELIDNSVNAEELNDLFESKNLIDVMEQEVEETPFDRIMNIKSSIHSMLGVLEAVNDSYKKAYMLAVIKSTIIELKKVYEM